MGKNRVYKYYSIELLDIPESDTMAYCGKFRCLMSLLAKVGCKEMGNIELNKHHLTFLMFDY